MANKKSKAQTGNKKKMSKAAAGSARKAGKKAGRVAAEVVAESPVRAYQSHRNNTAKRSRGIADDFIDRAVKRAAVKREADNGTSKAARNTVSKAVRQLEREPINTVRKLEREPISTSAEYEKSRRLKRKKI